MMLPVRWTITRHRKGRGLFADFDPPQTFALRADEILGNERQTVWRSGRALQAWPAPATRSRVRITLQGCATPSPSAHMLGTWRFFDHQIVAVYGPPQSPGFVKRQHSRRQLLWLGVTARPSAHWIAHQLTEAYGWQQTPRYIVRDRDCVYGDFVIQRLRAMGIRDRPISPRSPWQNGYSERLIGSIRRDCLDHVVVFGERHLRHLLTAYQNYYNEARTHLLLHKDAPI